MSNLTRLQAVSSSLDTAINKAENLPDAGSGGGASVETCAAMVISSASGDPAQGGGSLTITLHYTAYDAANNIIYSTPSQGTGQIYGEAALCNSIIVIDVGAWDVIPGIIITNSNDSQLLCLYERMAIIKIGTPTDKNSPIFIQIT